MTTGRRRTALAALSGVLAAALTLAVGHLLAAVVAPPASPFLAVGDAFVDATPPWLKDWAVAVFGLADKVALFTGIAVVLTALAAGIGVLALRKPVLGTVAVLGLGTVGAVAAATRPDTGWFAVLPSLGGAAAGAVALHALVARIPAGEAPPAAPRSDAPGSVSPTAARAADADTPGSTPVPPAGGTGLDRRGFLRTATVVAVLAALSAGAGTVVGRASRAVAGARQALRLPAPRRAAAAVPADAQSPVTGVVDVVTDNADFYRIDTALTVPQVDPTTWELRVHGMVDREVRITFEELLAEDLVEAWVTLTCVSNPVGGYLAGNARWLGLPVRDVLRRARPRPGADMVLSTSADGFTASTPLEALTDDRDALLAVGMNGEPLPLQHGFPVRMVVPGLYGYVSATKWLVDLEVTTFAARQAYWTPRGWSERGPVKTSSRLEVPRRDEVLPPGPVGVGGTAWAQHKGITAVEVQVDDGPWEQAELGGEISVDTWRQWSWTWDATPGRHVLRTRARDAVDGLQTDEVAGLMPDGATGWHTVEVTVRETP